MESVILVIHLFLALAIIGLVLLQRSEGGGLGIGGGGIGNLATAQGAASAITRITAICAAGFFITSLTLGVMAGQKSKQTGLIDAVSKAAPAVIEAPIDGAEGKGDADLPAATDDNNKKKTSEGVPSAPVKTD